MWDIRPTRQEASQLERDQANPPALSLRIDRGGNLLRASVPARPLRLNRIGRQPRSRVNPLRHNRAIVRQRTSRIVRHRRSQTTVRSQRSQVIVRRRHSRAIVLSQPSRAAVRNQPGRKLLSPRRTGLRLHPLRVRKLLRRPSVRSAHLLLRRPNRLRHPSVHRLRSAHLLLRLQNLRRLRRSRHKSRRRLRRKRRKRKSKRRSRSLRVSRGRTARRQAYGHPEYSQGAFFCLLERMTGWSGSRAPADVVAFEFAVESGSADAEHASGEGFVAFDLLKDALDGDPFDVFEVCS